MIGEVAVVGAGTVALGFEQASAKTRAEMAAVVNRAGTLMLTKVRAHASGRPGPRAQTGDYRRSWSKTPVMREGDGATVIVGTNAPQGRRLEFGFNGEDRLGRRFNQPPFPHVEPAFAEIEPEFIAALDAFVRKLDEA